MKGFRGEVQIPLPDHPARRAEMFSKLSLEWSLMLTAFDEIVAEDKRRSVLPVMEPEVPKPNGKHVGRPRGSKDKHKRKRREHAT